MSGWCWIDRLIQLSYSAVCEMIYIFISDTEIAESNQGYQLPLWTHIQNFKTTVGYWLSLTCIYFEGTYRVPPLSLCSRAGGSVVLWQRKDLNLSCAIAWNGSFVFFFLLCSRSWKMLQGFHSFHRNSKWFKVFNLIYRKSLMLPLC